jgi:hypothetical protein
MMRAASTVSLLELYVVDYISFTVIKSNFLNLRFFSSETRQINPRVQIWANEPMLARPYINVIATIVLNKRVPLCNGAANGIEP